MPLLKKFGSLLATALLSMFLINGAYAAGEKFIFVYHAPNADTFWDTVKNAVQTAAEAMDVTVEARNPPNGDLITMVKLLEEAVASNPDAILTTIADYDILRGPITSAVKKGIPVVTLNSGTKEQSDALGALFHIGQPEYDAGFGAGRKARAAGIKSFLCVNNFINNPVSIDRCQGFADGLDVPLEGSMIDAGVDASQVAERVEAYLTENPSTEAILTLGAIAAAPTLRLLEETGRSAYVVTFDISQDVVNAIKADKIQFAIDQQPFLQGFTPVVSLALYIRYGLVPLDDVNSGPGFVTKENLSFVEKYAGRFR